MSRCASSMCGARSPPMQAGALVLLVDPQLESRHGLWRCLSEPFGVIEATTAQGARRWIGERPDIDALVLEDDLPDGRGIDLASSLAASQHPLAKRTIVMSPSRRERIRASSVGITVVDRGDVRSILNRLANWFFTRDIAYARRLERALEKLPARVASLHPR